MQDDRGSSSPRCCLIGMGLTHWQKGQGKHEAVEGVTHKNIITANDSKQSGTLETITLVGGGGGIKGNPTKKLSFHKESTSSFPPGQSTAVKRKDSVGYKDVMTIIMSMLINPSQAESSTWGQVTHVGKKHCISWHFPHSTFAYKWQLHCNFP